MTEPIATGPTGHDHDFHSSWAEHYETTMHRTFGPLYARLTSVALDEVRNRVPRGGTVVDFGAGCGRLSIPLARAGYEVTAVEPSRAMLDVLRERSARAGLDIDSIQGRASEYRAKRPHDLALCVFTVISYIVDAAELHATLRSAWQALAPGGLFLLDVPEPELFEGFEHESSDLIRTVAIDPIDDGLHLFDEHTVLRTEAGPVTWREQILLRAWTVEEVTAAATACGFETAEEVRARFSGLGSHYLLLRRPLTAI